MASNITFRNNHGELVDIPSVASTEAKNAFGTMLDRVAAGGVVAITRHDAPRAVLVSYDEFQSLARARAASLETLEAEFDGLLERMQAPAAKRGVAAAFDATPASLGRAAQTAASSAARPVARRVSAKPARRAR